ncbi:MAG: dolichyl-phosphate beta-glucosyltransferase [archaeon]|nr:dolichyl-phosphate beta-glucosyltransferase [archaeon]
MISIILPAHNEAEYLGPCVSEIKKQLKNKDYEIIIAEDGSNDGTDKIAEKLAKQNSNIRFLHSKKKLGRGLALSRAFKTAKSEKIAYMDVDLATNISDLRNGLKFLDKYDVVTGSRYMKKSNTKREASRLFFSKAYNLSVRVLLGSKIYDHQCGFKFFQKDVFLNLNKAVLDTHWFWDTELLVIAQKKGYSVKEMPITWEEQANSKVNIKYIFFYIYF